LKNNPEFFEIFQKPIFFIADEGSKNIIADGLKM